MPELTLNGARIHYEDTGAGTPIVFAHGLLWSGAMYQFQVAALKERYRCVTFDFRGQGDSAVTDGGYDMDTLTGDAVALLETLGLGPCHFVGLSMGGFVGLRIALGRPELLRSLTLIESAADAEPRANIPQYRAMAFLSRLFGMRLFAGRIMKIMFGRTFLSDPARAELRAEMRRRLLANRVVGMTRALEGVVRRVPVEDRLHELRTPTLVLHGEEDVAIAPERARRCAQKIPGARLVMLPRAGHTASIEAPDAINQALLEFWASTP